MAVQRLLGCTASESARLTCGSHKASQRLLQPHPLQYLLLSMGLCISTTARPQSTGRVGQGIKSGESQRQRYAPFSCYAYSPVSNLDNSQRTASIHVLDDDSLLHVFYLYRPFFGDEDGIADWNYNARWWYALAHVC